MQAIFDNLTSIFVSSIVLLILVFLQFRSTMSATEQTINYMVFSEALNLNQVLERDLENMLTEAQTLTAIADSNYTGTSGTFTCELNTLNGRAESITFPTIAIPDSAMGSASPSDSDIVEVTYDLVATGDSINIPVNNVMQRVPFFELRRIINGKITASSAPYLTSFTVQFTKKNGDVLPVDPIPNILTGCENNLAKVRYEFALAVEGVEFISKDQRSTSRHNMSRFGTTVSLTNWE